MPERPSRSLEQGQRPRPYIKMAFYLDPVDGDTGSLVSSELVSLALWLSLHLSAESTAYKAPSLNRFRFGRCAAGYPRQPLLGR